MTAFIATARDVAPILLAAAVIGWAAYVVTRWREANARVDADLAYLRHVEEIAADTLARARRQEAQRKWERHCAEAFENALHGRPHLAAIKAAREAEGFDPSAVDWTERTGR